MAESHDRPPQPFTLRVRRYDPESGDADSFVTSYTGP